MKRAGVQSVLYSESWIAVCEFESERRKGCHVQLCMTCIPTSRGLKFLAHCNSPCYLWYVRMCGIWSPLLYANVESCHLCTCKRGIWPPLLHANVESCHLCYMQTWNLATFATCKHTCIATSKSNRMYPATCTYSEF